MIVYAPVSGTSVGLITLRICSIDCKSGLKPPCIVKIFSSMIAAIGKQLKQSVSVFQSLMLYRRLPGGRLRGTTPRAQEWLTFVIEPIDSVDARALVIASQYKEILWVFDLVGEKEAYSL